MISPQELLQISTEKIADNKNSVKLCPYKRINTKEGYSFITLYRKKSKNISASIEISVDWQHDDELGYLKNTDVSINTQVKIKGDFCILYQDVIIFINEFSSYTESMGQYDYKGKALKLDKIPLVDGTLNSKDVYGYSCLDLISNVEGFNIIPEYLALTNMQLEEGIFLVKVDNSQSLTPIANTQNKLEQIKIDDLSIKAINVSRLKTMEFVTALLETGLHLNLYGLSGDYNISEINNYDDYSNLRGIRYEIRISICYNIYTVINEAQKNISVVMFKMREDIDNE